jgi:hypothetical protein
MLSRSIIASLFVLSSLAASSLLPHHEEIAPAVHATGFAAAHGSANSGWIELRDSVLLVDLPRGIALDDYLAEVKNLSGKSADRLALTRYQLGDEAIVESALESGIKEVIVTRGIAEDLVMRSRHLSPAQLRIYTDTKRIVDGSLTVEYIPVDGAAAKGAAALHLPNRDAVFAGPSGVNGSRAVLEGSNSARWVNAIRRLEALKPQHVVPGFGSWGDAHVLARMRWYLVELRRQVAYGLALGLQPEVIFPTVRVPAEYSVWIPYDNPRIEDVTHVYREMTAPEAPFDGRPPRRDDTQVRALVLIADRYHEPEHIEVGLRKVFKTTGVVPHFTFDTRALSAENLSHVKLLVILKDGMLWPDGTERGKKYKIWMTPEQEEAVVDFVEQGGSFLNLHNSMGLYPKDGPYLNLVGGRYIGHGPLERFRVLVTDPEHPITQGVEDFSVADEQHTPPFDEGKVHVFLRSRSDDGKREAAAGWAYEPGRGRLAHLAPGHTREAMEHPMFQRLIRNAIDWLIER